VVTTEPAMLSIMVTETRGIIFPYRISETR